ncbi:hypothetical protein [Streptomyces sp. DH10]|uniref:hypothetical protein n=1 Tax=Streptomyces sp. DH10 TaxID=3040121 RepID=UPI002440F0F7|nr:hypothetical protein [Streptomyces sp. DH10]MDG9709375.1 hypothetical protein [Streptomyces sp. DH10]
MGKVVYLDQNHWVTMARARIVPEKIQVAEERQAADMLWKMVDAGQVRLPLSSAHLVETAHAGTKDRRRQLAQTMLDAYGGWHMLNPLVVRRYEFIGAFGGAALTASDVFTTAAESPFFDYAPTIGTSASVETSLRMSDIVWRAAWASTLLEETLPQEEQDATNAVIERWAAVPTTLAESLRSHPADRDMRMVAAMYMLDDLKVEIAQACVLAGISAVDLSTHLAPEKAVGFFSRLPFNGRVLEVTQARLRNASDKWVRNDLNDLLFLACAAGYADHVVAEKKTGRFLQGSEKAVTGPGASVHLNLRSLIRDLQRA